VAVWSSYPTENPFPRVTSFLAISRPSTSPVFAVKESKEMTLKSLKEKTPLERAKVSPRQSISNSGQRCSSDGGDGGGAGVRQ